MGSAKRKFIPTLITTGVGPKIRFFLYKGHRVSTSYAFAPIFPTKIQIQVVTKLRLQQTQGFRLETMQFEWSLFARYLLVIISIPKREVWGKEVIGQVGVVFFGMERCAYRHPQLQRWYKSFWIIPKN